MIDWVHTDQTVKQQYYIEVMRKFRDRVRKKKPKPIEQKHMDFASRQRLGAHWALCKAVFGGQTLFCN
ncbi:hypothetical protein TNCV_2460551 [Trichonephila clavipes]|nr:hypothetical protein TNCV_2460551 [Trichonephila clavipes]